MLTASQALCFDADRLLLLCFSKDSFLRTFSFSKLYSMHRSGPQRAGLSCHEPNPGNEGGSTEPTRDSAADSLSSESEVDLVTDYEIVSRDDAHTSVGPPTYTNLPIG